MKLPAKFRNAHLQNAVYSVADYVSLPALMLLSAPILLRRLGVERYSIWILASAAVTSGTLLSVGFGDAAIKYIAAYRSAKDPLGVERTVRTLLGINLVLSTLTALAIAAITPLLSTRLASLTPAMRVEYRHALMLGCVLLVVKAVESVFVCTQRAFERYETAARLSVIGRCITLAGAVLAAICGYGPVQILAWTLLVAIATAAWQARAALRIAELPSVRPTFNLNAIRVLFSFGAFNWLQGLIGLLTSQADRFLVGYLLGARALACYAICVQAASPIHGVTVAALQILFPYFATRSGAFSLAIMRRKVRQALAANVAIVTVLALPLLLGSRVLLRRWMGSDFAAYATVPLFITTVGFALMGLNVTGHFVLMAMGRVRLLAFVNAVGAAVLLGGIYLLAPLHGLAGAASGRLLFGPILCLVYVPLVRALRNGVPAHATSSSLQEAS